jgi:hypothetical protein
MTDHPDPQPPVAKASGDGLPGQAEPPEEAGRGDAAGPAGTSDTGDLPGTPKPSRRRVRRRAERPGTNPSADDAPDVVPPRGEPKPGETQHDRWLREQRPPHWE